MADIENTDLTYSPPALRQTAWVASTPLSSRSKMRLLLEVLFRQKLFILCLYATICVASAAYCFFWPPTYEATTSFLVKNDRQESTLSADQDLVRILSRTPVTEDNLNTETSIMSSNAVLEQTVREMKLDQLPEHWLLRLLNTPIEAAAHIYNGYHGKPDSDAVNKATERLRKRLLISPEKKSSVLDVSLRWGDPQFAKQILDRLSGIYLARHIAVHQGPDVESFFKAQAAAKKAQLDEMEARIQALRPGANPEEVRTQRELAEREAADFEASWRKAHAESEKLAAGIEEQRGRLAELPDRVVTEAKPVINETALGALKMQVLDLQQKHTELLQKYKPDQPLVIENERELADARAALSRELASDTVARTTNVNQVSQTVSQALELAESELASSRQLEDAMHRQHDVVAAHAKAIAVQAVQVQDLERERAAAEQAYLSYEKRLEEGRVEDEMNRAKLVNVSMIGPVQPGFAPVKPNIPLTLKLTLGLGLLLSIGFAFLLDAADPHVRSDWDLKPMLGSAHLVSLGMYNAVELLPSAEGAAQHR